MAHSQTGRYNPGSIFTIADVRLTAKSREVSKPRDSGLNFSNRSEIWQASRQQGCRDACQISERYNQYNNQSRGFETSAFPVRRLTAWWTSEGRPWTESRYDANFGTGVIGVVIGMIKFSDLKNADNWLQKEIGWMHPIWSLSGKKLTEY